MPRKYDRTLAIRMDKRTIDIISGESRRRGLSTSTYARSIIFEFLGALKANDERT